jgi:hypothetical protein
MVAPVTRVSGSNDSLTPVFRRPRLNVLSGDGRMSMVSDAGNGGRRNPSVAWMIPFVACYNGVRIIDNKKNLFEWEQIEGGNRGYRGRIIWS